MFLQGLKYIGNKEIGMMTVLTLSPTDPNRNQTFSQGEIKIIGKDINPTIARYLVNEYKGVLEEVDVEVSPLELLREDFGKLREKYKGETSAEEMFSVFCEVFGEGETPFVLVEPKTPKKKKAAPKKKATPMRRRKAAKDA